MYFNIYKDKKGLWRWRLKSHNGKIIADGGEGYSTKSNCKRAISTMMWAFYEAEANWPENYPVIFG